MFEAEDWSPEEERAHQWARLRRGLYWGHPRAEVPDHVEIEILDDPRYVRVGTRFGRVSLTAGNDDELGPRDDFYDFVDYGRYLPRTERPADARPVGYPDDAVELHRAMYGEALVMPTVEQVPITDEEYADWLEEKEDLEREEVSRKMLREAEAKSPLMRRNRREMGIIHEIYGEGPHARTGEPLRPADVEIYCSAVMPSGKRCWEKIGRAWQAREGWWIQTQWAPFKEAINAHLSAALQWQEAGWTGMRDASVAMADMIANDEIEMHHGATALSVPKPGEGWPDWMLIGCPRHKNVAIDWKSMRELVKAANRTAEKSMSLDCTDHVQGTLDWHASGQ